MGKSDEDFARHAPSGRRSIFQDIFGLLRQNKKWWLTPVILAISILGLLVVLAGTGVAPFIYTLF
jgi:hypothetical protein